MLQVVDRVRAGSGMNKKILVIDIETEDDLKSKGEAIDPDNAIIMIPRKISTASSVSPEWERPGSKKNVGVCMFSDWCSWIRDAWTTPASS